MSAPSLWRGLLRLTGSLSGQILLLLLLGVAILQVSNFFVVCSVQWVYVQQAERSRAEHLVTYWFLFNAMEPGQREAAIERMKDSNRPEKMQEMVELLPSGPDWDGQERAVARLLRLIEDDYGTGMKEPLAVVARRHEEGTGIFPVHLPVLETAVRLSDGAWLKVTQPFDVDDRKVVWFQRGLVLVEAIVILALMGLILLRVTRPMRQLGAAAEAFGRHPELSRPLPETGVKEVRDAAQSFNRMRERICGNLAERDRMIAAMAHDLRTPLTKQQLRLDRVEPAELREKLQATVDDMQAIISQGLAFTKSLNTDETPARMDLGAFLQSLADDHADVGAPVTIPGAENFPTVVIEARPLCLKRCLENLVVNACAYGGSAEIGMEKGRESVAITVADHGPGIPEDMLERVFEPYFRLEGSRNRASGGTGLGLAIARNMALLNGGELTLGNRPEGGLVARVTLPLGS